MAHAVDANLHAFVHESVGMHARADARLVKKIDRDLLDDAGANAAEHVFAGLPFENDIVDAMLVQELTEQESDGPAPIMATWVRVWMRMRPHNIG